MCRRRAGSGRSSQHVSRPRGDGRGASGQRGPVFIRLLTACWTASSEASGRTARAKASGAERSGGDRSSEEVMSGAQGAHPAGQTTPTTYESVGGGENRTRTDLRLREDQGAIQIDKVQDKVDDAAGRGVDRRAFGDKDARDADAGTTGTGA